MESPQLGYVIIYVQDVTASIDFYEKAFALERKFVHESGSYAELSTGSTSLAFADESAAPLTLEKNRVESTTAGVEVALVTDAVEALFRRAIDAGAKSVSEPQKKPWGQTVGYVRDLNGFLVEICSPVGG